MKKKQKRKMLIDAVGWYGVAAILSGYAVVSFSIASPHSLLYQLLNLTGAGSIVIEALSKRDKQPAVINGVVAVIAAIAIVNILR